MAIAVPPWVQRVMLRDHGPASPTMKVAIFAVNSFMPDNGSCFASHPTIAKAASLGESTVQRVLGEAIDAGWLGVEVRSTGKGWKTYQYRAAVPDALQSVEAMVEKTVAGLVLSHQSKYGPIAAGGRPFKQGKRNARVTHSVASPREASKPACSPRSENMVPSLRGVAPLAAGICSPRSENLLPSERAPKSVSEVPILSSYLKLGEEGALEDDRTLPVESKTEENLPDDELTVARKKQAAAILQADPKTKLTKITRLCGLTFAQVQQVKEQAACA